MASGIKDKVVILGWDAVSLVNAGTQARQTSWWRHSRSAFKMQV
jgi:hypothetical protein